MIGKAKTAKGSYFNRGSSNDVISTQDKARYWKRVLIVDDDVDTTTTFKLGIENATDSTGKRIGVCTYNDPRTALLEFQPNFYDLLLVDINMPSMDGFQLSERILNIDISIKICFMSSGQINRDALKEIHASISLGYFIRKPVTIDYLMDRLFEELD